MKTELSCPKCGAPCSRDSVDNGVAVIYGPWGCPWCAWSSDPEYDFNSGQTRVTSKGILDQWGGLVPNGSRV
jgi:hypothetical protein